MEQKTAVEWLIHELNTRQKPLDNSQIDELFEEAKAMEKEQIIEAVMYGDIRGKLETYMTAEEYYNETYNK